MQSKFFRTASRSESGPVRREARGFTLLELLIVVTLAGLVVGVVTVAIGRLTRSSENRAALIGVVNALTVARVEAMRTSRPVRVTVRIADGVVQVEEGVGERQSTYHAGMGQMRDSSGREVSSLAAEFDSLGRTRERLWQISESPTKTGPGLGQVGAPQAVRIWRIEFDPVSGAPVLRPPGEPGAKPGSGAR